MGIARTQDSKYLDKLDSMVYIQSNQIIQINQNVVIIDCLTEWERWPKMLSKYLTAGRQVRE